MSRSPFFYTCSVYFMLYTCMCHSTKKIIVDYWVSATNHQRLQTLNEEAESSVFLEHYTANSSHLSILQQLTLVAYT